MYPVSHPLTTGNRHQTLCNSWAGIQHRRMDAWVVFNLAVFRTRNSERVNTDLIKGNKWLVMVGVPAFFPPSPPHTHTQSTLWSRNTQLLMNWTPHLKVCRLKCGRDLQWEEGGGGLWSLCCEWSRPQQHNTRTAHYTAAPEGLQASMEGGQFKLGGDHGIPNQGGNRGGMGTLFSHPELT